jgi:hypothetical protein
VASIHPGHIVPFAATAGDAPGAKTNDSANVKIPTVWQQRKAQCPNSQSI